MKKYIGLIFLLTLVLSACGNETPNEDSADNQLKINTTVYPLQYFTKQIAGDAAQVTSILPPGTDPHTYEPTTKEMIKIAEADAFIYSGAGLESYAETIAESVKPEGVQILEASMGVKLEEHVHNHDDEENSHGEGEQAERSHSHKEGKESEEEAHLHEEGHSHDHQGQDPHIWLDPIRSIQLAENIKEVLIELQPGSESQFNKNFNQLEEKLLTLDQQFHDQLENTPKDKIIVSHAAYGYWEQAYGIEQIAVSGLSPTSEPSQKELEEIIQTAEKNQLNYVLFEQNVTPKVSEIVQNEIGAEPLRIHNLSVLTDEDISNEEDYFSLMKQNLEVLIKALSK
ncbi:metal ABC transporter solute-binding protein, Zn/Mn family [Halobacillus amylolyticus]|uniref:Zinc ABC transporter substrate-binding protein n=1 Tax=Halobacillus amylolyticus TaxID=2932259 RepID=A0ABY4HF50_9BACI|nr:zinc ABC transporter substrate-binding protein [Halobacillus amylolyticus]UOR13416.1 zinc ABC transporter substrate-binding protein [Halobacillus amylolyticus]